MRDDSVLTITYTRRAWLATAATLLSVANAVQAAPTTVEIVAYAHPPVQSALKPLREWLATQGGRLKVVEIDMETQAGEKRLQEVGVKEHVPVVVLIDGQYRHKRDDGSTVEFFGFPTGPGNVKGSWSNADVEAVLKARAR